MLTSPSNALVASWAIPKSPAVPADLCHAEIQQLGSNTSQHDIAGLEVPMNDSVSMRFIGQQSVQMHGGIGVTDEYIGSHYFKKLTQLELTFGDTLHHLGEVSARMQDTAGVFA